MVYHTNTVITPKNTVITPKTTPTRTQTNIIPK